MADYFTLKTEATNLRKARNFIQALPLFKQLWEEHRDRCNEWEGWGYALCLKNTKDYHRGLEICREVYALKPDFDNIKGVYASCIYYTEISVEIVHNEHIFLKAGDGIIKLLKQEDKSIKQEPDYPCIYTLSLFKILIYLTNKAIFPTDKVEVC